MRKGITRRGALGGALAGAAAAEANARVLPRGLGAGTVAPPPTPIAVNLTPSSAVVVDTATVPATLCSIAVTMSDGSTFTGSLTENNANTSISVLSLRLDTMPADGLVSILVSATQNSVTVSSTFSLTVTAPGAGTNFVTSVSAAGARSGSGNYMGTKITLGTNSPSPPADGPSPQLIVSALGRWKLAGNTGNHTLKIVDALTGLDVPGSSVTVNMTAGTPGTFTYGTLVSPVTLDVHQSYYVVSLENNADLLSDSATTISHTGVAFPYQAYQFDGTNWNPSGPYESCYGPLDFIYTLGLIVNVGSAMPQVDRFTYGSADSLVMNGYGAIVASGTVTIDGGFQGFHQPALNSVVVQYWVDGVPVSPFITGPVSSAGPGPNFPWTVNTATHPAFANGTHHVVAKFVDSNSAAPNTKGAYNYECYPAIYIAQNPIGTAVGDYSAAQLVPTGPLTTTQPYGANSWLPDFVNYPGPGLIPPVFVHSRPNFAVAPTSDPKYRDYFNMYVEDMSAMKTQEFTFIRQWGTTNRGGVYMDGAYGDTGGTVESAYNRVFRNGTMAGGRCAAVTTAYCTFIADPRAGGDTGYIGITLQGALIHLSYTGDVTHLAGIAWDHTKLRFNNIQTQDPGAPEFVTEAQVIAQCIVKGTLTGFAADEFGGLNDLCVSPLDLNKVYLVNTLDSFIILVDLNFTPPHCSVYAGSPGNPGYVNAAGTGATNARFDGCSSVVMCDGSVAGFPAGTMLVADHHNGAIRRISPDGLTVTTLCGNQISKPTIADLTNFAISDTWSPPGSVGFTPGNDSTGAYINTPFTLRWASKNPTQRRLVLYENNVSTLRIIDIVANTVTRIKGTYDTKGIGGGGTVVGGPGIPYDGWFWFDVDTVPVFGPLDDIAFASALGGPTGSIAPAPYSRVSLDGNYMNGWVGDGTGRLAEGPGGAHAGIVFAPLPEYAWICAFSRTRSHFLAGGFRYLGIEAGRPVASSDPDVNVGGVGFDLIFDKVSQQERGLWWNGTCICFPIGARPSFANLYGEFGGNVLGNVPNFEKMVNDFPTDGSFTAEVCAPGTLGRYFQDGGAGVVPRPELTGNDLRALCYYVRRVALSGSYPTAVEPGPINPDTTIPIITGVSAVQLSNTADGGKRIQVSWLTSGERTIGIAVAGSAAQQTTGYPYNLWSLIEAAFGTSHAATISGIAPGVTTLHYSVIAKDVAGNSAYSTDQTITLT